jgi:hypothetical protein
MTAGEVMAIIPLMMNPKFVNVKAISETTGYPVRVYECPHCHSVELNHEVKSIDKILVDLGADSWIAPLPYSHELLKHF